MNQNIVNIIIVASARAAFVCAWADCEERGGRSYPGKELFDIAPATPAEYLNWAKFLWHKIGATNDMDVWQAWRTAAARSAIKDIDRKQADIFGHYIAMEAMGHGVCWEDDHQPHGLDVPYMENKVFYVDND